ncbi:MAG: isoprenylcysteine carboxylmethyltransferase family protein [Candidatus Tectomicrobia bacterium]|uniref:Isoprenylcysteine carboxylmethyltransferase family protein n=1 Tax=Tectimicrobiota bacterium TaxID=2528274 RepID=A0A933LPZ6_UNCTE|nr:isoprenylcysteine carboxylmethyltransferase family protein [Candidatus Tectomicrobia bacterium]
METLQGRNPINKIVVFFGFYWRTLNVLVIVLAMIIPLLHLNHPADPIKLSPPEITIVWDLFIFLGPLIRLWASGYLQKNQEVCSKGPYRVVRHPFYLGTLLCYLGFFMLLDGLFYGGGLFLTTLVLVYYPRILYEEEYLLKKFGGTYGFLKHDVPRICPFSRLTSLSYPDIRGWSLRQAWQNRGFSLLMGAAAGVLALSLWVRFMSN